MLLSNSKNKLLILFTFLITILNSYAHAGAKVNFFDEFDPRSPEAKAQLEKLDREYEKITGLPSHLRSNKSDERGSGSCYKSSCKIWADVDINTQRLSLYIDGALRYVWKTSTGRFGFETPPMSTHPDGRMYEKHTSPKYPEGDYKGLGNMPFAVFIDGGYAIHGTTRGSWGKLGETASHGCIRIHPDMAEMFYVMVRRAGIRNVWISVM